jgi:ABC-type Mn2+/Zn2+ transport system ATPase subunit
VTKLAAAVRTAGGWWQLPGLQQLSGQGLQELLRLAVADVVKAAGKIEKAGGHADHAAATVAAVEQQLLQLASVPVTVAALEATGVARQVKLLKKHRQQQIAAAAGKVIAAWRSAVTGS